MKHQIKPQPPALGPARPQLRLWLGAGLCAGAGLLVCNSVSGAEPPLGSTADLATMSLEQLLNIEVTSVSRRGEKLSTAPAAIHVITGDEIRRSGATSIPEALRLSPGLEVGQVDAHNWAVTSRGFNDLFANKLLVLMDGRSSYTPLFSGVRWDVQDTMLEDIERIEVVRGPGATLWGANAVNGVINVMTKSARDTQGTLVSAGGGTEESAMAAGRYGGHLGEHGFYRVYGKYNAHDSSVLPDGTPANDRWQMGRGGFRYDWEPLQQDHVTVQGEFYGGQLDQTVTQPIATPPFFQTTDSHEMIWGGNALGRWTRTFNADSELTVQTFYDVTRRESAYVDETRHTFDLDFQHRFALAERNEVIWGAGYRLSHDQLRDSYFTGFDPLSRTTHSLSAFVQDDLTLVPDRLRFIFGSKFERTEYAGVEYQPSGRLLWTPSEEHTLWGGVSRAVRTPSRAENDIILRGLQAGTPPFFTVLGDSNFRSEELTAFEMGWRVQPHRRVSVDVATFYNLYDHLRTSETFSIAPDPGLPGSPLRATSKVANKAYGETYGVELAVNYQPVDWWRLSAAYTFLNLEIHRRRSSNDVAAEADEGKSPHHQVMLRSSLDLPGHVQFDLTGRYVDELPGLGVPSYFSLDARIAWAPTKHWEISVVGQNLLDDRHPEFAPSIIPSPRTEVQRGVYGKVTFRF